ncbi:MAG: helix-turn-helix transcriptional regulator [Candidatus Poribacteria bacterium]|nr:helix-turn-helix transcriptional regulator [Candidatus Poribacteria bacterium]
MPKKDTVKRPTAITPSAFKKRVGRSLKRIRKTAGLTQTEFGERIGIAYYQVSRYERGLDEISLWLAVRVCEEFHVELPDLIKEDIQPLVTTIEEAVAILGELSFPVADWKDGVISAAELIKVANAFD